MRMGSFLFKSVYLYYTIIVIRCNVISTQLPTLLSRPPHSIAISYFAHLGDRARLLLNFRDSFFAIVLPNSYNITLYIYKVLYNLYKTPHIALHIYNYSYNSTLKY